VMVIEATRMDRSDLAEEMRDEIEKSQIADTEVRVTDEGVTVSLQNIQFLPDSAVLQTTEKKKLEVIAGVLSRYPEHDILVTGHTALAGTEAGRQQLSEERARAVGGYLLQLGVRSAEQIVTRGVGAREPIAENTTEEGRRKNRRVEITILEN
jgi:outer membrane protein OmpA-like peptidoglycan-associated protein